MRTEYAPNVASLRGVHNSKSALHGLFHRTAIGNLEQSLTLFCCEGPRELDLLLDPLDTDVFDFALLAVWLVRASLTNGDGCFLERPLLSIGVHPQRDSGAAGQCSEQVFVRRGARIGPF